MNERPYKMKAEKPAQGVLKTQDFGDSMFYVIPCSCGCGADHELNVEADETGIWIRIYFKAKTNWWSKTRWQNIWTLLTKGYTENYNDLHMTQQQALNYAETIKSAMQDVEKFKADRFKDK